MRVLIMLVCSIYVSLQHDVLVSPPHLKPIRLQLDHYCVTQVTINGDIIEQISTTTLAL